MELSLTMATNTYDAPPDTMRRRQLEMQIERMKSAP
jgi:hypothetical protein